MKGIILACGPIHGKSRKQWWFPAVGWDECLQTHGALPNRSNVLSLVVTTAGSVGGECETQRNQAVLSAGGGFL